jgi:hypothetical protein
MQSGTFVFTSLILIVEWIKVKFPHPVDLFKDGFGLELKFFLIRDLIMLLKYFCRRLSHLMHEKKKNFLLKIQKSY